MSEKYAMDEVEKIEDKYSSPEFDGDKVTKKDSGVIDYSSVHLKA